MYNTSLHPSMYSLVYGQQIRQGSVLNWPFFLITSLHCRAAPSNNTACRFQGNERGQSLSTSNAFSIVWVYCVSWPLHIYIQSTWLGSICVRVSLWNPVCNVYTCKFCNLFFLCADTGHFRHSNWVSNQWKTRHVCLFVCTYFQVCVCVVALQVMRTRPSAVS